MQVNKYVHPCERFPQFIKKNDQQEFEKDYSLRNNERIRPFIEKFDKKLLELFFGNAGGKSRIHRY